MIGLDDAGTFRRLRALRHALIDPAIRKHGGNLVETGDDSLPVRGICVSREVRDHVRNSLDLPFEDIGLLTLKNIAQPVEAFVLRLDPGVASEMIQGIERCDGNHAR